MRQTIEAQSEWRPDLPLENQVEFLQTVEWVKSRIREEIKNGYKMATHLTIDFPKDGDPACRIWCKLDTEDGWIPEITGGMWKPDP